MNKYLFLLLLLPALLYANQAEGERHWAFYGGTGLNLSGYRNEPLSPLLYSGLSAPFEAGLSYNKGPWFFPFKLTLDSPKLESSKSQVLNSSMTHQASNGSLGCYVETPFNNENLKLLLGADIAFYMSVDELSYSNLDQTEYQMAGLNLSPGALIRYQGFHRWDLSIAFNLPVIGYYFHPQWEFTFEGIEEMQSFNEFYNKGTWETLDNFIKADLQLRACYEIIPGFYGYGS
ncbi:MAG: hypothetical protein PF447_01825, partial [Spirochaetaceae bacterium]|nr:hypothetical protein [Spirochaetaceae bacterium]